jgi:hypothetical protein
MLLMVSGLVDEVLALLAKCIICSAIRLIKVDLALAPWETGCGPDGRHVRLAGPPLHHCRWQPSDASYWFVSPSQHHKLFNLHSQVEASKAF